MSLFRKVTISQKEVHSNFSILILSVVEMIDGKLAMFLTFVELVALHLFGAVSKFKSLIIFGMKQISNFKFPKS